MRFEHELWFLAAGLVGLGVLAQFLFRQARLRPTPAILFSNLPPLVGQGVTWRVRARRMQWWLRVFAMLLLVTALLVLIVQWGRPSTTVIVRKPAADSHIRARSVERPPAPPGRRPPPRGRAASHPAGARGQRAGTPKHRHRLIRSRCPAPPRRPWASTCHRGGPEQHGIREGRRTDRGILRGHHQEPYGTRTGRIKKQQRRKQQRF